MKKCEFCQGDGFIEDEYGEWKLEAMRIVPLSPQSPYWALFMKYLDEDFTAGEKASFPIKFCPMCGMSLSENKVNVLMNAEEMATALRRRKTK